jgi:hypothetical protein
VLQLGIALLCGTAVLAACACGAVALRRSCVRRVRVAIGDVEAMAMVAEDASSRKLNAVWRAEERTEEAKVAVDAAAVAAASHLSSFAAAGGGLGAGGALRLPTISALAAAAGPSALAAAAEPSVPTFRGLGEARTAAAEAEEAAGTVGERALALPASSALSAPGGGSPVRAGAAWRLETRSAVNTRPAGAAAALLAGPADTAPSRPGGGNGEVLGESKSEGAAGAPADDEPPAADGPGGEEAALAPPMPVAPLTPAPPILVLPASPMQLSVAPMLPRLPASASAVAAASHSTAGVSSTAMLKPRWGMRADAAASAPLPSLEHSAPHRAPQLPHLPPPPHAPLHGAHGGALPAPAALKAHHRPLIAAAAHSMTPSAPHSPLHHAPAPHPALQHLPPTPHARLHGAQSGAVPAPPAATHTHHRHPLHAAAPSPTPSPSPPRRASAVGARLALAVLEPTLLPHAIAGVGSGGGDECEGEVEGEREADFSL